MLLEAANFEPIGVLKTSERLALRTEGSNKWEKGVDPYAAEPAAVLASRLLVDLAGAELAGHADVHDGLPERPGSTLRPERARRLIGLDVADDEQRAILDRPRVRARRLGGDGADVAGARRDARDRPRRGGRARRARPCAAHDAAPAFGRRAPDTRAALPPGPRGRARRRRLLRGLHVEPDAVRSPRERAARRRADERRARRCCGRRCSTVSWRRRG